MPPQSTVLHSVASVIWPTHPFPHNFLFIYYLQCLVCITSATLAWQLKLTNRKCSKLPIGIILDIIYFDRYQLTISSILSGCTLHQPLWIGSSKLALTMTLSAYHYFLGKGSYISLHLVTWYLHVSSLWTHLQERKKSKLMSI